MFNKYRYSITTTSYTLVLLITYFSIILVSCDSSSEEVTPSPNIGTDSTIITASDFSINIDENPINGIVLGTVQASASDNSTLTYTLSNQSVAGALVIDANTGDLSVLDSTAFDYETNTSIMASYVASNGTETATGNITITINDVPSEIKVGDNGLIAHYTFDNTLSDAMGNFPNMMFEGEAGENNPTATQDRNGETEKAYDIRRTSIGGNTFIFDKYIKLENQEELVDTDKNFTVAIWVYPNGDTQDEVPVIYKEFDYELQVSPGFFNNGTTFFSTVKYSIPSDTDSWGITDRARQLRPAPRIRQWSHIAMVCDNDKVRIYINGIEVKSNDITADSFKNSGEDLYIGAILAANGTVSDRFTGSVDDFRYYNQALTETQIQQLANDTE